MTSKDIDLYPFLFINRTMSENYCSKVVKDALTSRSSAMPEARNRLNAAINNSAASWMVNKKLA